MSYAEAHGKELTYLQAIDAANYIHRTETTLLRLAEMECDSYFYNLYWKDGVNPKQKRAEKRIVKFITETIGCKCYTQRDPRGFAVHLYLKDESTNQRKKIVNEFIIIIMRANR